MKTVIIGAGSGFGSRLSVDILSRKPLEDSTIALCDIDGKKLDTVCAYVRKVIDGNALHAKVIADTDRRKLLPGADFVVIAVSIGGPAYFEEPYESEIGIPRQYGVQQTVGDTIGPGGIFRALRTGPALIAMAEDIRQLAPGAMILNYTNPMAILTWVLTHRTDSPVVGLCHSVQGTAKFLADILKVSHDKVGYRVAGINHMAWFLEFTCDGKDAYPHIRHAMQDAEIFAREPVRFEIMQAFGYFVTESSRHMSEYVPWYQHDQETMRRFSAHPDRTKAGKQTWLKDMGVRATQDDGIALVRSHEYASGIVEAAATGEPMRFNGNVLNHGLISNLPEGCCVEVACTADRQGIHPDVVGALPPQCAALCRTNTSVQELAVRAVLDRDRDAACHALLLDPSVGAVLTLKQARKMFDEMWESEGGLLDGYP